MQATLEGAAKRLTRDNPFAVALQADDLIVELYAPVGRDEQTPHDREELYVVMAGSGRFSRGSETVEFGPGDVLHVPAHTPHRFVAFSDDFRTWVVFYGPSKAR